jgi:hypothetical protein
VRFHLGFRPREVTLSFAPAGSAGRRVSFAPARVVSWRADRAGAFTLFAAAGSGGDASYVGCIVWR